MDFLLLVLVPSCPICILGWLVLVKSCNGQTLTRSTASSPIINNYDKVTDPAKERAKKQMEKMRNRYGDGGGRHGGYDDEYVEYDRHEGHRRQSDRRDRPRAREDDHYDDSRGGRAKSMGRDSYGGRSLRDDRRRRKPALVLLLEQALTLHLAESRRSFSSGSSESSISPRRAYKHRKSLGEQALAALGLGGVLGAEKEKERERRSSRERRSDRDRAYRREDRGRGYDDGTKPLPAGYLGYNERQQGYQPDSSHAGTVAKRNGYAGSQSTVTRRSGDFQNARGEKRGSTSESSSESSSDVISSSEEDRRQKKMKGKEFLTAGLVGFSSVAHRPGECWTNCIVGCCRHHSCRSRSLFINGSPR